MPEDLNTAKTECHRLQLWAQCCDKKPVQIIFCGHTLFERSAQKYIVAPLIVVGSKIHLNCYEFMNMLYVRVKTVVSW